MNTLIDKTAILDLYITIQETYAILGALLPAPCILHLDPCSGLVDENGTFQNIAFSSLIRDRSGRAGISCLNPLN